MCVDTLYIYNTKKVWEDGTKKQNKKNLSFVVKAPLPSPLLTVENTKQHLLVHIMRDLCVCVWRVCVLYFCIDPKNSWRLFTYHYSFFCDLVALTLLSLSYSPLHLVALVLFLLFRTNI